MKFFTDLFSRHFRHYIFPPRHCLKCLFYWSPPPPGRYSIVNLILKYYYWQNLTFSPCVYVVNLYMSWQIVVCIGGNWPLEARILPDLDQNGQLYLSWSLGFSWVKMNQWKGRFLNDWKPALSYLNNFDRSL